jgi:hypothetical protein
MVFEIIDLNKLQKDLGIFEGVINNNIVCRVIERMLESTYEFHFFWNRDFLVDQSKKNKIQYHQLKNIYLKDIIKLEDTIESSYWDVIIKEYCCNISGKKILENILWRELAPDDPDTEKKIYSIKKEDKKIGLIIYIIRDLLAEKKEITLYMFFDREWDETATELEGRELDQLLSELEKDNNIESTIRIRYNCNLINKKEYKTKTQ